MVSDVKCFAVPAACDWLSRLTSAFALQVLKAGRGALHPAEEHNAAPGSGRLLNI